jgi:hypothetical protein
MKPLPTDPMAQHTRFIEALCQDWRDAGTVTRITPRADRVLEINKQLNAISRETRAAEKAAGHNHGD